MGFDVKEKKKIKSRVDSCNNRPAFSHTCAVIITNIMLPKGSVVNKICLVSLPSEYRRRWELNHILIYQRNFAYCQKSFHGQGYGNVFYMCTVGLTYYAIIIVNDARLLLGARHWLALMLEAIPDSLISTEFNRLEYLIENRVFTSLFRLQLGGFQFYSHRLRSFTDS